MQNAEHIGGGGIVALRVMDLFFLSPPFFSFKVTKHERLRIIL